MSDSSPLSTWNTKRKDLYVDVGVKNPGQSTSSQLKSSVQPSPASAASLIENSPQISSAYSSSGPASARNYASPLSAVASPFSPQSSYSARAGGRNHSNSASSHQYRSSSTNKRGQRSQQQQQQPHSAKPHHSTSKYHFVETEEMKGNWRAKEVPTDAVGVSSPGTKTFHPRSNRSGAGGNGDGEYTHSSSYYNPYDPKAPTAFRSGIDAIYGLPFGGSLAFIYDGTNGTTSWKKMGDGMASLDATISEKLTVSAMSGGLSDGDFSKILVNGVDYSPNQKGINILVIDPVTLDAYVGVFDTHTHIGNESSHLTRFLSSIPEKHLIVLSVRYDASRRLHPDARAALVRRGVEIPAIDSAEQLSIVIEQIDLTLGAELLSMAATVNAHKCARLLLEKGWDVNHQKKHGSRNTPLLDAVFHGSVAVVKVLLECNADRTLANKWHETAGDIAIKLFGYSSLEQMVADFDHLQNPAITALPNEQEKEQPVLEASSSN